MIKLYEEQMLNDCKSIQPIIKTKVHTILSAVSLNWLMTLTCDSCLDGSERRSASRF